MLLNCMRLRFTMKLFLWYYKFLFFFFFFFDITNSIVWYQNIFCDITQNKLYQKIDIVISKNHIFILSKNDYELLIAQNWFVISHIRFFFFFFFFFFFDITKSVDFFVSKIDFWISQNKIFLLISQNRFCDNFGISKIWFWDSKNHYDFVIWKSLFCDITKSFFISVLWNNDSSRK